MERSCGEAGEGWSKRAVPYHSPIPFSGLILRSCSGVEEEDWERAVAVGRMVCIHR